MRTITIKRFVMVTAFLISVSACNKVLQPYDSKSDEAALATPADLEIATYGVYAGLVNENYTRQLIFLSEYQSDNVALASSTTDDLLEAYNYNHFPAMGNTTVFWQQSYKVIYSANRIIEKIKDGGSSVLDQLKGENLYLRAMCHFNLVRLFGRPYPQGSGNNPGIVIKDSTANDLPARSTVKQVYDFVINDLLEAASLMSVDKDSRFASKEAAYALLSRVYLYKEDNVNAALYATKVINSTRYQLMATDPYKKYFTVDPENNPETIFAIRHMIVDNRGYNSIGSMFYDDPVTRSTGWAQMSASLKYIGLLDQYPQDVRHSFIEPLLDANGQIVKQYGGQTPCYMINKFSWQDGVADLSSPVYLRLAEMYLNRAEANAKIGNLQEAIDDVNIIRKRAGLSGSALFTLNDLKGLNTVLDVVLQERNLELSFEGQRAFDLFRNNLPMIRDYPGYHGTDHIHQTINPADNAVIYFIPEYEINNNPNLTQNP